MASDLEAQEHLEVLFDALQFAHAMGISKKEYYGIATFTDHIALGWPIRDDAEAELGGTIINAAYHQFALARFGLFARGGLAIGDVFFGEGFAFGPGLVKAYELESKVARHPRVVVDEQVVDSVRHHGRYYGGLSRSPYEDELLWDSDDRFFVNYLDVINDLEMAGGAEILRHKTVVERGLVKYREAPWIEKYHWLADYHNYWCKHRFAMDPSLLIPITATHSFDRLSARL